MKLEELQGLGVFVNAEPVKKKVKIGEAEIEVGIERLSFAEAYKIREDEKRIFPAALIARCLVFDGGERMSYAQACKLDSAAFGASASPPSRTAPAPPPP